MEETKKGPSGDPEKKEVLPVRENKEQLSDGSANAFDETEQPGNEAARDISDMKMDDLLDELGKRKDASRPGDPQY